MEARGSMNVDMDWKDGRITQFLLSSPVAQSVRDGPWLGKGICADAGDARQGQLRTSGRLRGVPVEFGIPPSCYSRFFRGYSLAWSGKTVQLSADGISALPVEQERPDQRTGL